MTRATKGWGQRVASVALFLFSALCVAEMAARLMGFHNTPLYEKHDAFEYRTVPNQRGRVYLNDYTINSLGMRGDVPDTSGVVVWICGDSVINGGVHCDEDSLAVARVDEKLESALGCTVSTLNISQGSWGPENTWAFVRHFETELGTPDNIVLVLNSQDWRDEMTHCYPGDSNDMPSSRSGLGLIRVVKELIGDDKTCESLAVRSGDTHDALISWMSFAREKNIPFAVHMHPSLNEMKTQEWTAEGAQLVDFLNTHGVFWSSGLNEMKIQHYRDQIHLTTSGQRCLAKTITQLVYSMIWPK